MLCEDCGHVIDEERIEHGPEWRAYDDEKCERTGSPLTVARHDRGLSTETGRGTDAKRNDISWHNGVDSHGYAVSRPEPLVVESRTESRTRAGRGASVGECA